MSEQPSLDRLVAMRERLVAALSRLPGASTVYLFGSTAGGFEDRYSDVDLTVLTTDLEAARAALAAALSTVGAVDVPWPLATSCDDWCATVLWRDESPYHRADVGLSAVPAPGCLSERMMPGGVAAWQGHCAAPWPGPVADTLPLSAVGSPLPLSAVGTSLPIVAVGTAAHAALGHIISGLRYAKARRRGQSLVCWRYVAGLADWTATLLLERADGWQRLGRKIADAEYYRLDGVAAPADRQRFAQCLDFATPAAMDASVCRLLHWLTGLCQERADAAGEAMHPAAARLLAFIGSELVPTTWASESHCGPRSRNARAGL